MKRYKGDMHIHTVLSPCGSLEMSPKKILEEAARKRLDFIGIADHNSTKNCEVIKKLAGEYGLEVFCGAEINTKEEVHCLAFFEKTEELQIFQTFIDNNLPDIKNKPEIFGHQVMVDANENILEEIEPLLIAALKAGITEVEKKAHELNGIFIPAHIDRVYNGLINQLGIIPEDMQADAFEIYKTSDYQKFIQTHKPIIDQASIIKNSDAHHPEDIGEPFTWYFLKKLDFSHIKQALHGRNGNFVKQSN